MTEKTIKATRNCNTIWKFVYEQCDLRKYINKDVYEKIRLLFIETTTVCIFCNKQTFLCKCDPWEMPEAYINKNKFLRDTINDLIFFEK